MRPSTRRALAAFCAQHGATAARALISDVRASSLDALHGALEAAADGAHGRQRRVAMTDATVIAVTALLAPFPQGSGEKARLLAAHLEKLVGRPLPVKATGLASAVRALKAYLSEDDIRDGAFSLRVTLREAKAYKSQLNQDDPHES